MTNLDRINSLHDQIRIAKSNLNKFKDIPDNIPFKYCLIQQLNGLLCMLQSLVESEEIKNDK